MATVGELSTEESSECSVELGMDYPRIEYPQEIVDRACGRLEKSEEQPLVKKQKVDDCLSDADSQFSEVTQSTQGSQSSQTTQSSQVSSRGRERRGTNVGLPPLTRSKAVVTTKRPAATKKTPKKVVRKPLKRRRSKKVVNYAEESSEESDEEAETEDEEESQEEEEVDSSPEKKRRRSSRVEEQQKKTEKEKMAERGRRTGRGKEEKQKTVQSAKERAASKKVVNYAEESSEESDEPDSNLKEKKDKKKVDVIREKKKPADAKDGKKSNDSTEEVTPNPKQMDDRSERKEERKRRSEKSAKEGEAIGTKSDSTLKEKQERKKGDETSETKKIPEVKVRNGEKTRDASREIHPKSEQKDIVSERKKEKEKSGQSMKNGEATGNKSDPDLNEKKERKSESSDAKELMKDGKKATHSIQEALPNPEQKDNRSESTVPSTPQKSTVTPPLKSILKNATKTPLKRRSSDNSVLPSVVQDLFNSSSITPPAPHLSSTFLSALGVKKKKKDTGEKRRSGKSPSVEKSEETAQSSNGWDPRNAAFVPPSRNFGKPTGRSAVCTVERRRSSDSQRLSVERQTSALLASPPLARLFNFNEGMDANPAMEEMLDDPLLGFSPSDPFISPNQLEDLNRIMAVTGRTHTSTTVAHGPYETTVSQPITGTPSRLERGGMGMESPPGSSLSHREDYIPSPMPPVYGEELQTNPVVKPFSGWISCTESPESARRGTPVDPRSVPRWEPASSSTPAHAAVKVKVEPRERSPAVVNTPASPPRTSSSSSFGRRSLETPVPTLIPIEPVDKKKVRWRFMPIDDFYLPTWKKSARYEQTSAVYAASQPPVRKVRAIVMMGPIPDTIDRSEIEDLMNNKNTEVQWTEAPPTKDALALALGRSMVAILCYDQATARALLAEENVKVGLVEIPVGSPMEVLLSVDGVADGFEEKQMVEAITDVLETYYGPLVELMLYTSSRSDPNILEGKARFFHGVHASRAAHGPHLKLSRGRHISFTACPPEKSTVWVAEVHSEEAEVAVPAPSTTTTIIKQEPVTTVSDSAASISLESAPVELPAPVPSAAPKSKFCSFGPPVAIPPPRLLDPQELLLMARPVDPSALYSQTISIPAISVAAASIPLPPPLIPPPSYPPILLHHFPPIQHHFFPAPPPFKRRNSGGREGLPQLMQLPIAPPAAFQPLLPKKEEVVEEEEEKEVLLFARPADGREPMDWDAVRAYFKDDDCSSRVYGGIVSLRFTGEHAKEKAQVLMVNAPHVVNDQLFSIGITYSVLLEANKALAKMRLYEELMERFGSVVEVVKKCDSPAGKPVYKVYFGAVEKAEAVAAQVITVGESTFISMGPVKA